MFLSTLGVICIYLASIFFPRAILICVLGFIFAPFVEETRNQESLYIASGIFALVGLLLDGFSLHALWEKYTK